MTGKKKIFIAVGIVLNILLCGGLYVNYQLDHVVTSLSQPGILFPEIEYDPLPDEAGLTDTSEETGESAENGHVYNPASPGETLEGTASPEKVESASKGDIASGVQNKISRPIEKTDLLKAGVIILRRLNSEEISYLYHVGSQPSYTHEEYLQVHKILEAKLSDEDVVTLKELGKKYGKTLNVLDDV